MDFNIFLPDNPCRKGRTGRVTIKNGELFESTLVMISWFRRTSAKNGSWYLEERYTTDLEDYHNGY